LTCLRSISTVEYGARARYRVHKISEARTTIASPGQDVGVSTLIFVQVVPPFSSRLKSGRPSLHQGGSMENTLNFLLMLMRSNAGFERCGRRQLSTGSRRTSIEDEHAISGDVRNLEESQKVKDETRWWSRLRGVFRNKEFGCSVRLQRSGF
jgi:hypothetical protein